MNISKIQDEALKLPIAERARLAQALLSSLDGPADEEIEAAWIKEIQERAQEIADGKVRTIDWESVHEQISQGLS